MNKPRLPACLAAILFFGLFAGPILADGEFTAVGVQLKINPGLYTDAESFSAHAAELIDEVLAEGDADLVVFPEYTGVFFAFFDMEIEQLEGKTLGEGLEVLEKRVGTKSLKEFFLTRQGEETMDRIWGELSRRFQIAILGGTCFASAEGASGRELRNRAVLYDKEGEVLYRQDKVYLTPFETDIIGIDPGPLSAARSISLLGRKVGISICRDTFFPPWEKKFAHVDLWIDIKANGEIFDDRQADIFRRALPARLINLEDTLGMTVCLNGDFLDLLWEGPSSVIRAGHVQGNRVIRYLDRTDSVREESCVRAALP